VSRRRVECRVCGEGFSPRAPKQDVCSLDCFARDRRRLVGWPTRLRQALRSRPASKGWSDLPRHALVHSIGYEPPKCASKGLVFDAPSQELGP